MSTTQIGGLLTPDEAAEVLTGHGIKVTGGTVRRWATSNRIRHLRLPSGQIRLHREDVEALLTPVEPDSAA